MFDIGLSEMAVIAIVAIFVFGPEKLPELAKQAGRMMRRLRDFATDARDDLREELGPDYADLELRDLDPRAIVRKHIIEAMETEDDDEGDDGDGPDPDDLDALDDLDDRPDGEAGEPVSGPGARDDAGLTPLAEGERPPYDPEAT